MADFHLSAVVSTLGAFHCFLILLGVNDKWRLLIGLNCGNPDVPDLDDQDSGSFLKLFFRY